MDDRLPQPSDLTTLLERVLAADVELVLVGGLAAVVQGAPVTTFDVDIVHRRTEENVDRLLTSCEPEREPAALSWENRRPAD
jgi:hypothetical protein